ncbi:MAG: hypothetical protein JWO12_1140 [Frankiales bacterium]|nr:hypothetical protein [Frankiales bacterium]
MTLALLDRAAGSLHRSKAATAVARIGLLARAVFYLLLAYLVVRVVVSASGPPANASGALRTVSETPLGAIPVALAAVGFAAFGLARLLGAVRDRAASRTSRLTTGLQGLFYLGLSEVPASFALGSRSTGTEHQQRATTAKVLMLPAGRFLVIAAGLVLMVVCGWQVVTALRSGFTDSLNTRQAPRAVRLLVRATGKVGIVLRALVFLPIGVFLLLAGIRFDPNSAKGLDATLRSLAHDSAGRLMLLLVAGAFTVFALYTLLEARYRDVDAGN